MKPSQTNDPTMAHVPIVDMTKLLDAYTHEEFCVLLGITLANKQLRGEITEAQSQRLQSDLSYKLAQAANVEEAQRIVDSVDDDKATE